MEAAGRRAVRAAAAERRMAVRSISAPSIINWLEEISGDAMGGQDSSVVVVAVAELDLWWSLEVDKFLARDIAPRKAGSRDYDALTNIQLKCFLETQPLGV